MSLIVWSIGGHSPPYTMAVIALTADRLQDAPAQIVSVRATWAAAWVEVPYLYALRFSAAAAPDISESSLEWRYGEGQQAGLTTFANYSRQSLAGYYVRIALPDRGFAWYGIIIDDSDDRTRQVQTMTAQGLEVMLDHAVVDGAYAFAPGSNPIRIGRPIPFNRGTGESDSTRQGNRSANPDGSNIYRFTAILPGTEWTARQIIDYLLHYFPPRDASGNNVVNWGLTGQLSALDLFAPAIGTEGRTIRDLLNSLIDRRRGLGWRVVIDPAGRPVVDVFTFSDTPLPLANGMFPANAYQDTITLDASLWQSQATVQTSAVQQVDQVEVIGARMGAVVTIGYQDGSLEAAWSSSDETAYQAADSAQPGYSSLDREQQQERDKQRRSEDSLSLVYSRIRIPDSWDGGTYGGDASLNDPVPAFVLQDDPSQHSVFWFPGLRIEKHLPLKKGVDYSADAIAQGNVTAASGTGERDPLMLFALPSDLAQFSGQPKYSIVEQLGIQGTDEDQGEDGRRWTVQITVDDGQPAIDMKVQGAPQHALAGTEFTPLPNEIWRPEQWTDWREALLTVYILQDQHVTIRYPQWAASGDVARIRRLNVPDAHLDWIPAQTVVDVLRGDLKRVTTGAWLRDDRNRLRDIARLAWLWYGTPRRTMTITAKGIDLVFEVGHLITTVNGDLINTVITRVDYDLSSGSMTARTQWAELEWQATEGL